MIDFSDRKDLLVLLIIGILVVVAAMIFSLIMIWAPKEDNTKFYVGKVSNINIIPDEYKIDMYLKDMSELLTSNNYEELYKLVGEDYIQYSGMDINKLKQKLEQSNISGQQLILENYETKEVKPYNKVYIITAASKKDNSSIRMTIREKSPRQYTIAFDDFVLLQKSLSTKVTENVTMELLQTKYTSSKVTYDIRITNKNLQNIVINSLNKTGIFLLNYSDETLAEENQYIEADRLLLLPNESEEFSLTYDIKKFDWSDITGITLRDVKLTNDRVNNILFEF